MGLLSWLGSLVKIKMVPRQILLPIVLTGTFRTWGNLGLLLCTGVGVILIH